jgi:hypothetical protein
MRLDQVTCTNQMRIVEKKNWSNVPTDWYNNRPPIRISKGAEKGYGYDVGKFKKKLNYMYLRIQNRAQMPCERSKT